MTGYESKRAAARDKLDDDDTLTIAYQSGFYDGKKAAQPAQEPVATVTSETENPDVTMSWWHEPALPVGTKLYTTPPQRPWVGLTDDDIFAAVRHLYGTAELAFMGRIDDIATARAIVSALRSKNT